MKFITTSLIIGLSILSIDAMSQSDADYAAIASFLPADQLETMEQEQPLAYQRLAYMNRHAYHISQFGEKGTGNFPSVYSVNKLYENQPDITLELIESQELNLLGYDFEYSLDQYHYYKLDDNGTVLSVAPLGVLYKKANLEIE